MHEFRNEFIEMQTSTRLLNYNCGIRGGWQSAAGRRKIILDMARAILGFARARPRAGPRGATGGNLLFAGAGQARASPGAVFVRKTWTISYSSSDHRPLIFCKFERVVAST